MNLKEIVRYDPESGALSWLVSGKGIRSGARCGKTDSRGYHIVKIKGKEYPAHRLAWFFMTGEWPDKHIDHINRDRLDNRWANLRLATHSQNQANRPPPISNTSGFKGVTWHKNRRKWQASIRVKGEDKYLGLFDCPEEAGKAYSVAAYEHFGRFARSA